jgi:hypothetical protein
MDPPDADAGKSTPGSVPAAGTKKGMKSWLFSSKFSPLCSELDGDKSPVSAEVLSGLDELTKN